MRESILGVAVLVAAAAACGSPGPRGTPKSSGAPAPEFSLVAHDGSTVTLADVTRTGPAVLVFYRGHW